MNPFVHRLYVLCATVTIAVLAAMGGMARDAGAVSKAVGDALERGQYAAARAVLESEAAAGDAEAQYILGKLALNGLGGTEDVDAARRLFTACADRGHGGCQTELGVMYLEGLGVARDFGRAMALFRAAADRGVPAAQFNIGAMHHSGAGRLQDIKTAIPWYRRSADRGYAPAMATLGKLYVEGVGVPRDVEKGRALLESAAKKRNEWAFYHLAFMARKGIAEPRSAKEAYIRLRMAERLGHPRAGNHADAIAAELDEKAVRDADAAADRRVRQLSRPSPRIGSDDKRERDPPKPVAGNEKNGAPADPPSLTEQTAVRPGEPVALPASIPLPAAAPFDKSAPAVAIPSLPIAGSLPTRSDE